MESSWKWSLAVMALVLAHPAGGLSARDRTWHGATGEVISRGDYYGVRAGQVILSEGTNKKFFPLSAFSLDDRDALIDLMKRRKHEIKIAELMQFENLKGQPRAALGAGGEDGIGGEGPDEFEAPEAPETPETTGGAEALLSVGESATQVYGLPVPFAGLLEDAPSRTWTSLLGQKAPAVFEELVAPAHVKLRDANGRSNTFALANFERSDIDWLQETIAADAAKDIFPAADPQPLTPEETEKKYRTWIDRKGRRLSAGFVRVDGKQVVLDTAGGQQSFALIGLSGGDRDWLRQEMLRRAEEARRQQEEARRRAEQAEMASNHSGNGGAHDEGGGGGGRNRFGRRSGGLEYSFHCPHCGNRWTGGPFDNKCANCIEQARQREQERYADYEDRRSGSGGIFFTHHCSHCQHKWLSDFPAETCPSCNGRGNGGGHDEGDTYAGGDSSDDDGSDSSNSATSGGGYTSRFGTDMWQCERCKHTFAHVGEPTRCPNCGNSPGMWTYIVIAKVVIAVIVFVVIRAVRS